MAGIRHNKVATLPDEAGAEVNKTEWNEDHIIDASAITNSHLAGSIDKAKITNTAVTLSDTQTLTGKTIDVEDATNIIKQTTPAVGEYLRDNGTKFVSSTLQASDLPTGIDATKIADGTVTSSEFQFINTLSSNAQTQIDGKAASGHTHVLTSGATDVTITATNLNILDDGVNTSLHFHDADRARANHTGTQTASTISDYNSATATFTNKTIDVEDATNIIKQTTPALGELLVDNGTKFVSLTKGSALQQLRVNAGATDIEWATIAGGSGTDEVLLVTTADKTVNADSSIVVGDYYEIGNGFFVDIPATGNLDII